MPCILSRAARWFGLRALLACLLFALATCVHASNVKIIIPEPDVDWPWKPQLNLSIPDEYFTGAASSLTDADQWRVLSYVGAPFRISSGSSDDLMQVLELVAFMRADGRGQCPHYTTSYRTHYYRFHYAELELLYGEARWAALQRLQEPSTWSLVLTDAVGPAVREAEHVLAKRRAIDPPGLVLVNMREENGAVSQVRVPLGDFRVSERVFLPGHRLEYRMPQLTIDWEAGHRRRHLHYFLQTKEKFTAQVAAFDAATLRAQRQLQESLESLQKSEQSAYDANAGFKMRYQRFLKERQQRTSLSGAGGTGNASDTHLGSPVRRAIPIQAAAPQARTPPARQAVACRKVTAAWATLVQNGLRWSQDRRAVQLRRLHVRHGCPTALSPLPGTHLPHEEEGAVKQSEGGQPVLTLAAQRAWRIAVAEMMAQRAKSGRPPTFAQLFAALFGVWEAEREGEVTRLNATTTAATAAAAEKSAPVVSADFVRFVDTFLESGEAVAVAGGRLPRHIRAELQYLLGILHLVSHNTEANIPSSLPGSSVSGVVRGVLHLHESLASGSHHAAGALATLREHGIFTRQHTKAALQLLLRSMQTSPSYLLRHLLHTPRSRSGAAAAAATASPSSGPSAASLKDPSHLLRFEQFYAVDHTLQEVDDPFMTRESVRTMVAITHENTHSTDDAPELEDVYREAAAERGSDGGNEGSITARLSRRALKANILLSGFKDTPRDAGEAECELLVVLRQLGYFCDVDLRSLLSSQRSRGGGGAAGRLRTAMGLPFPPSCPEHAAEVFRVLGNPRHTLLQCSSASGGTAAAAAAVPLPTHTPAHLSVPTSETLYSMLHTTLLSLSYVHLLHTGNYELSHLYASLSLEMSLRLQQLLVKRFGRVRQMGRQLKSAAQGSDNASAGVSSSSSPLSPYEALLTLAEGSDEVAFAAEMLADDVEAATERAEGAAGKGKRPRTSPDALAQRAVERCRSVADSPFVYTEALLLLGLSRWAKGGALAAGALQVEDVERRLSQWTVEPFRVLASLLSTGLPTTQPQQQRNSPEGEDELRVLKHAEPGKHAAAPALHPAEAIDAHALFLLCLAAMKRWKRDFSLVHLLDSTSYSVRRTDPFVLASFLLHARDATTGAPVLSIAKVRALAHAAAPHFLGRVPHFLPLVDDTVESYAARLLRFATRHIHGLEPAAELLRSGSYAVGGGTDGASVSRRRRAVLDDAPPRRFRLRTLRRVKQQTLETADLQPLLYAADVHEYLNASRWTFLGTALHAAYNALLYPFTSTTSESILSAMASRLQFIEPSEQQRVRLTYLGDGAAQGDAMKESGSSGDREGKEDANRVSTSSSPASDSAGMPPLEEASSVSAFVSAFAEDAGLREHFIACQLLSFTLESGMPEGFSLLFYEATDRGNPYAQHLANYLADDVFGRWTASVWTEHHVSAQWQREKAGQPMDGSFLTLNTRSPFRYASVEGRQELFARLSRWKAARALAAATKNGHTKSAEALDHLLWCAGLLTRRAFYDTGRVHQMAFEGAIFPAADLQCVAEVGALIQREKGLRVAATGAGAEWSKEEWLQAQTNATQLLRDLGDRLAFDYDLIDAPPARRLPPSEADYHRNLSDPAVNVPSTDLQHTPRKRFAQASTQLVEPWNRRTREISVETLTYGEGTFYNGRLHRVSGHRWGAALQSWWLWLRHVFP